MPRVVDATDVRNKGYVFHARAARSTVYAFGLRRNEAIMLDLADLRR
jgi:hypothetical protein